MSMAFFENTTSPGGMVPRSIGEACGVRLDGWPMTVTATEAVADPDVAVIDAVPDPTAVISPVLLTVATLGLLVVNCSGGLVMTLPDASATLAVSCCVCPGDKSGIVAGVSVTVAAAPAIAVAVKVVVSDPVAAVSVFGPTAPPNFQLPTVAIPLALVVATAPVTEPPPDATVNETVTPAIGL